MDAPTTASLSPAARPTSHHRSKSNFSITSRDSQDSHSKRPKISTKEAAEAERRHKHRFSTDRIADPNMAVREAEPADRNLAEKRTMAAIREIEWKDVRGNAITDPDASNPSRSRMERPLDTIRAFEAAIDSQYRSKKPQPRRPESTDNVHAYESRRSSLVGNDPSLNMHSPWSRQRGSHTDSYYGGRPPNHRYSTAPPRSYSDANFYPAHGYHESHETVGTGESLASGYNVEAYGNSYNTDAYGNSTDPSSENSSVDRMHQAQGGYHHGAFYPNPSPVNGHSPERQGRPSYQAPPSPLGQQQYYGHHPGAPPVPEHAREQRGPIRLGGDAATGPPPPPKHNSVVRKQVAAPPPLQKQTSGGGGGGEKRQSWLRRRFSRN